MLENPAMYDIARQICHEQGVPWTDPRTGITYPPPSRASSSDAASGTRPETQSQETK
jgi:hypothetical protein